MTEGALVAAASAGVAVALLFAILAFLALRRGERALGPAQSERFDRLDNAGERQARELRAEMREGGQAGRLELAQGIGAFQAALSDQMGAIAGVQNGRIDAFARELSRLTAASEQRLASLQKAMDERMQAFTRDARAGREEGANAQRHFGDGLGAQLATQLSDVRATIEARLSAIETQNAQKLDEMRRTVDEKLHATLELRLGESFKLVSDRLEAVHKGLGEMQSLAVGVGDLRRVLTNVKSRGTWGEVQLGALLEQILTPEQYATNVATVPGSGERVEYAIRLPGREIDGQVWLPVDSKFPIEDYDRIVKAQEAADAAAFEAAAKALEGRIKVEGRRIRDKYVQPPHTTDFCIMFLPIEGLYAEVLRRPGLTDYLQRECRVSVAGPTTLAALLNSLQMGFRTLAIEKRTSEVWQILGAVKTEFGKFGDALAATRRQLETAARSIQTAETGTVRMARRLKEVEAMPDAQAERLLNDGQGVPGPRVVDSAG